MAYTPFQDGTQLFGIPDSPISINSVAYIAEGITIDLPQTVVEIKDPNGVVIGQEFIPGPMTGRAKLQFATATTVAPARNQTFTLESQTWIVETVSNVYTQGQYAYCNLTFRQKFN